VQASTITLAGQIKGAGALVKPNTAGTLILTGTNAYTGGTTLSDAQGVASALRVATSQALGTGAIAMGGGGNSDQCRLELTGGVTLANTINAWASRNTSAANILNVSGINTINSAISGGSGGGQSSLQSDAGKLIMKGACTTRQLNLQGAGDGDYLGALNMSGYGLVKSGGGTWTLGATNTYTGTTVINAGVLVVNGMVPTNGVSVAGGTLAGTGVVRGATTVQTNATLAPGVGGIGTLTVSNWLTLAPGSTALLEIARNGAVLTNDLVRGVTTLTNGGLLVVTNIGSSPLQVGDSFKLLSATTYSGTFTKAVLPSGYSWNNRVALDGTLTVLSVVNPVITALTLAPNGASLTLSGTNGLWGGTYTVLAATNVATPLAGWVVVTNGVFDSVGRFSLVVTNTPAPAAQFYRISIP
jgi:autotransporter-associated beta strand protein